MANCESSVDSFLFGTEENVKINDVPLFELREEDTIMLLIENISLYLDYSILKRLELQERKNHWR